MLFLFHLLSASEIWAIQKWRFAPIIDKKSSGYLLEEARGAPVYTKCTRIKGKRSLSVSALFCTVSSEDMSMSVNLEDAAKRIYEAVFDGRESVEVEGITYPVSRTSKLGLREVKAKGYTFLEQNKEKDSAWGRLAREGHRILWIMKGRKYLTQVSDGVFHNFRR